jgi:oxygen-independent coproporphyrinogen-3 oxidase
MRWGGGTSSFYSTDDMAALFQLLRGHFELAPEGDYSIDVDVRSADPHAIRELRAIGFNRLRFAVRDIGEAARHAASQSRWPGPVSELTAEARNAGFESIDIDLMAGRARQTLKRLTSAVELASALRPDRIAIHVCDHASAGIGTAVRIRNLKLLASAAERLVAGGYVYIGMDQFALPGDALAVAQREGRLHWSCQGYSTHANCDSIGLGISAIGAIGPTYCQNARTISEYYARLDGNELPIVRGIQLARDDLVRRDVIQRLMCHFQVSKEAVGVNYLIDFESYFAAELEALRALEQEGLVEIGADWICVTPRGRLLVCVICRVFDRYCSAGNAAASHPCPA